MVKTPKMRHSKPGKDPVTIDLEPGDVSRVPGSESSPEKSAEESAEVFGSVAAPAAETGSTDRGEHGTGAAKPADTAEADDRFMGSEWPPEASEQKSDRMETTSATSNHTAKADEPVKEPAANVEQPAVARRGGSSLLAGLAGGVIALAGVAGLQTMGFWPGSAASGSGSAAVSALETDVATLKQEIDALKGSAGGAAALQQAVTDVTGRVDQLNAAIETVKADVETLRAAVQSGSGETGDAAAVAALESRIAGIEQRLAGLTLGGGADPAKLSELEGKIASIEEAVRAASEATGANEARFTALEQGVADLGSQVEGLTAQPKVVLALTGAALKAALDRGGPFSAEVEAFAVAAPNAPELAELRTIAMAGVATRQQLVAEADQAAKAMIAAGRVVDENAGFFDRLWSSAESLVTVRPIGAVEGAGVPETVARMEQAVKDGDLAKAMAEYDSLPEAAKAAGADYAAKVRARLQAEQLVDKAMADALKAA